MSEEGPDDVERGEDARSAVVLDYLPHGRADDDRPQYQKPPLAYAVGTRDFGLYELVLAPESGISIGDEVAVEPPDADVEEVRRIGYDELSGGARSELDHVVRELIEGDEERVVEFYNEAGPITLRLHQLNLLPGIGDKLRDDVIDARRRKPFESVDDIEERISGLHDPVEVVIDRAMEELRDEDVKYKLFVRPDRREE